MTIPPYLKVGDTVGIVSTSNFTEQEYIDKLCDILEGWGLKPVIGKSVGPRWGSFAGPDELRRNDLQEMLDDPKIKAIFETMGGYGIIRIIDQIDFNKFKYHPKWIVGYSDTTFLHSHLQGMLGIASLQATMAADLSEGFDQPSWESLRKALFGEQLAYKIPAHPLNRSGSSEAVLVGGTVSILCNAKGTFSDVNTNGKILFLEEVGEKHFRLDSYLQSMKHAGKFKYIKGLVVGHLTDMKEDQPPFGKTPEEIILDVVKEYDFPICFGFPAGHNVENRALIFGGTAHLAVTEAGGLLSFLQYQQKAPSDNVEKAKSNGHRKQETNKANNR